MNEVVTRSFTRFVSANKDYRAEVEAEHSQLPRD